MMCGLVGAVRADALPFHHNVKNFLWQGLYISALRGFGGTGVGVVDKDYDPCVSKSQIDAASFVLGDMWDPIEKEITNSRAILGHTRAPTGSTAVTKKNAHPFVYCKTGEKDATIMLTHNGHISNANSLTPVQFQHPVDSAHVAYAMAADGEEKVLKAVTGAYVFVWYNHKTKTFNIARDDNTRELFYTLSPEGTDLYYASEKEILTLALVRNGLKFNPEIKEVPAYMHYAWDLTAKDLLSPKEVKYEKKYPPTMGFGTGGYSTRSGETYDQSTGKWTSHGSSSNGVIPKEGTLIWVNVPDPDAGSAFRLYNKHGASNYGAVNGIRNMDMGIVIIESVTKDMWENKLKKLHKAIPCVIQKVWPPNNVNHVPEYTCKLDYKMVDGEYEHKEEVDRSAREWKAKQSTVQQQQLQVESKSTTKLLADQSEGKASRAIVELPNGKCKGPVGLIDKEVWREKAKEGCYFCTGVIIDQDMNKVGWYHYPSNTNETGIPDVDDYQIICTVCREDPTTMGYAYLTH